MATCIALALTAAISACGGGSGDGQSPVTEQASNTATVPGASDAASTPTDAALTTTNGPTVADVTNSSTSTSAPAAGDTSATPPTSSADASAGSGNTVVAGADSAQPQTAHAISQSATVARPAGNTGKGFYVVGSKLYDPKGNEFRIRGVNRNHWDSYGSPTGLPLSGANTVRIVLGFNNSTSYNWDIVSTQLVANKIGRAHV